MKKLVVVGGGITGLSVAYFACKSKYEVHVVEAAPKIGGLLNTFEIGGNRLEHYYHHFFTHDAEINWLIKDLGIEHKLMFKKTSMGVYREGHIYNFNGAADLLKFKPIGLAGIAQFGFSSLYMGKVAKWRDYEHVSALEWLYKYAGKRVTDSLWKPLLDIKFGPYAQEVPLAWLVGRLRQRFNSRKNGDEQLGYLHGSLQVLLDAMVKELSHHKVQFHEETKVNGIEFNDGKIAALQTSKGEISGDEFVFTIPTLHTYPLLEEKVPKLANSLKQIEYFGAVCVILELNRPLSQIYWLNVADSGFPFGGVIEHTNFIPADEYGGSHIAYLSRYFAHSEEIAQMNAEEIKALMLPHLKRIYPKFHQNWIKDIKVFKTQTAATVCDLGFSAKVPNGKTEVPNLFLANMAHIYPDERSTNNAIRVAAELGRVMGMSTAHVPYGQSLSGQIGF